MVNITEFEKVIRAKENYVEIYRARLHVYDHDLLLLGLYFRTI